MEGGGRGSSQGDTGPRHGETCGCSKEETCAKESTFLNGHVLFSSEGVTVSSLSLGKRLSPVLRNPGRGVQGASGSVVHTSSPAGPRADEGPQTAQGLSGRRCSVKSRRGKK